MIIPYDHTKKGVIIEFKVSDKPDDTAMQAAVDAALFQIQDKSYSDEFIHAEIKEVVKIGIAFCGKVVRLAYKEDILL